MITLNREALIAQLQSVEPGLAEREVLEQSSCFVFRNGRVHTFNQDIACSQTCELAIEGAVRAKPLLQLLTMLVEETLDFTFNDGHLIVTGKRKEAGIVAEKQITLPIDTVEKPGKWHKLDESFVEAIELVQHCASNEENQFMLTCIHITPDCVEACDNTQAARVKVATPVQRDILVRRDSIKHITSLGMTEISETESWVHFRNPMGLTLSCMRYIDENYVDVSSLFRDKGEKIVLPKGLISAAEKANVFAQETTDDVVVFIELRPGKLRLRGKGAGGWYKETRQLAYEGPALAFTLAPQLLMDICKKYTDAEVTREFIRVRGGKWRYAACLDSEGVEKEKPAEEKPAAESEE